MTEFNILTFDYDISSTPDLSVFRSYADFMKRGELRGDYPGNLPDGDRIDINLILAHASGLIRDINKCKDVKSTKRTQLLLSLEYDYNRYFDIVISGNGSNKNDLRDFSEILFHYGLFKVVYNKVDSYLRKIQDGKFYVSTWTNIPDFYGLYLNAGDIELHRKRDYIAALKYYELIERTIKIESSFLSKAGKIACDDRDKGIYEYYSSLPLIDIYRKIVWCIDDIEYNTKYSAELDEYGDLFAAYNSMVDYDYITEDNIEDIITDSDHTFKSFARFIKKHDDSETLRIIGLMSLVMYSKFLMVSVYKLSECTEDIRKKYQKDTIRKVSWLKRSDTMMLTKYAEQIGENTESEKFYQLIDYSKVYVICRLIDHELKDNGATKKIAYYTSLKTFSYMLPEKCKDDKKCRLGKLTVMHMSYMNDPTEGKLIVQVLCDGNVDKNDERKNAGVPYVFMKCFTPNLDYLPMWNMYGDNAKGVCVVIDWVNSSHKSVPLYNVCYVRHKGNEFEIRPENNSRLNNNICSKVQSWLYSIRSVARNKHIDKSLIIGLLGNITFLFKDASYSYEQEQRIIYSYDGIDKSFSHTEEDVPKLFIQPDFTIQINELILGPKFPDMADTIPYLMEEFEKMSRKTGKTIPRITISDVQYR